MKALATFPTPEEAQRNLAALELRQIYGCIGGCKARGYKLLVNENDLTQAQDALKVVAK